MAEKRTRVHEVLTVEQQAIEAELAKPVKVIFRKWRWGGIIALFPELPADRLGIFCDSYEHIGGHSAADYDHVVEQTVLAYQDEYAELEAELVEHYGYELLPMRRCSDEMHRERRRVATAWRRAA